MYDGASLTIEPSPTKQQGIECATDTRDNLSVKPEETPQETRSIHAELFPRNSILNNAHSLETDSTSCNSRSFGTYSVPSQDSTVQEIGPQMTTCHFMGYGRNDEENEDPTSENPGANSETRLSKQDSLTQTVRSRASFESRSLRTSFDSGSQYHYPAALYDQMKTQKHFVPTTITKIAAGLNKDHRQTSETSVPFLPSHVTNFSDDGTSRISSNSSNSSRSHSSCYHSSFGGSVDDESRLMEEDEDIFPQFEALVDTMALSLEPQDQYTIDNKGNGHTTVLSFVALVDKLTEGQNASADSDYNDDDCSQAVSPSSSNHGSDRRAAPTNAARAPRLAAVAGGNRRYSVPSALEQSDSSEMLANIRTLALMAHGPVDNIADDNQNDEDGAPALSFCSSGNDQNLKFHRSSSAAHPSSASVCSELRWM